MRGKTMARNLIATAALLMMSSAASLAQTPNFFQCVTAKVSEYLRERPNYLNNEIDLASKIIIGSCNNVLIKEDSDDIFRSFGVDQASIQGNKIAAATLLMLARAESRVIAEGYISARLRK
jgi:hypothetical protein